VQNAVVPSDLYVTFSTSIENKTAREGSVARPGPVENAFHPELVIGRECEITYRPIEWSDLAMVVFCLYQIHTFE
jgi:hypothetical protein